MLGSRSERTNGRSEMFANPKELYQGREELSTLRQSFSTKRQNSPYKVKESDLNLSFYLNDVTKHTAHSSSHPEKGRPIDLFTSPFNKSQGKDEKLLGTIERCEKMVSGLLNTVDTIQKDFKEYVSLSLSQSIQSMVQGFQEQISAWKSVYSLLTEKVKALQLAVEALGMVSLERFDKEELAFRLEHQILKMIEPSYESNLNRLVIWEILGDMKNPRLHGFSRLVSESLDLYPVNEGDGLDTIPNYDLQTTFKGRRHIKRFLIE
eukprot:TRINITY_DN8955_c0_g1_i1.p1 TRINITY_DN8955_c0_g1~~TRINITY_DN8955_c0_g1_i1.p1  ORF type:complete len:264 (-),score=27.79 TRINITY_DN8955_c0_g1_i1:722-1513(-)